MTASVNDPWFLTGAGAEYARCHEKTLLLALRRGECVGYQRTRNGVWRIYKSDLDSWIRGEKPRKARRAA